MQAELKSQVLKIWRPRRKGLKTAAKMWVFMKRLKGACFFVTAQLT